MVWPGLKPGLWEGLFSGLKPAATPVEQAKSRTGDKPRLEEGQAFYAQVGVEDGGVGGQGAAAVVEEAEADEVVAGYDELGFGGVGFFGVPDADDAAMAP